ncbi:protein kinase, putative [Bodo saltans]|uniref:Protein kinase, putative n=1 Tax=Bodo saltans TaxID=75058 RepID=A0A0S4JEV6_BODSA|nr:protein kinase, putative [Bodo saltans]|eukprot:CUG86913.1 protein kinase, putative [Bodo saltans]
MHQASTVASYHSRPPPLSQQPPSATDGDTLPLAGTSSQSQTATIFGRRPQVEGGVVSSDEMQQQRQEDGLEEVTSPVSEVPTAPSLPTIMLEGSSTGGGGDRRVAFSPANKSPASSHEKQSAEHSTARRADDVASIVSSSSTAASSARSSGTMASTLSSTLRTFWHSLISVSCIRCDGRISISALVVLILGFVAIFCAGIGLTFILVPLQNNAEDFLHNFADATVLRTSTFVDARFQKQKAIAELAKRVTYQQDILGPNIDLQSALTWFARDVYAYNFLVLLFRGPNAGFTIGTSSPSDPVHFPYKEGYVVVNNATNGVSGYLDIGYFSIKTFKPLNETHPFTRNYNLRFNFSARPYAALFTAREAWSNVYVGVLTRTSSIGIGGPWGPSVGAPVGTYSVHDYTEETVAYLHGLEVSSSGVVMMIDVKSRAFVGGNIDDVSVAFTANGTAQLVLLENLGDPRASLVIRAGAVGFNFSSNALLTCRTPCEMVYSGGKLFSAESRAFSLFEAYTLVRVGAITDNLGLNMRLIVILPSTDFIGGVRKAAMQSIYVTASVVAVILLIVFVLVHIAVTPLREVEAFLQFSARLGQQQHSVMQRTPSNSSLTTPNSDNGSETSSMRRAEQRHQQRQQNRRLYPSFHDSGVAPGQHPKRHAMSSLKEVNILCTATMKLAAELKLFSTFLPHQRLSLLQSASGRDLRGHPKLTLEEQQLGASSLTATTTAVHHTIVTQSNSNSQSAVGGAGRELQSSMIAHSEGTSPSMVLHNPQRFSDSKISISVSSENGGIPYAFDNLWRVPVTTVVCNLCNFDGMRKALQHTELLSLHTYYVGVVQAAARLHGGAVELMHGDHIWVHLNAAKRVVGHAAAACRMMLAIEQGMRHAKTSLSFAGMRLGASTGRALCGFMGASSLKSFTVVGEGVGQAAALIVPVRLAVPSTASPSSQPSSFPFSSLMSPKTAQLALCSKDVVPRHVRLSLMPYETEVAVISTPVLMDNILAAYPPSVGLTSPAAALARLQLVNAIFDHLGAGQTREAQRMLQLLTHQEDEWLLRTFSL